MENQNTEKPKTVKLIPSSQVYCVFDLVEIEGKQMIAGSLGFKDQWGMDRMAQTAGEKGIKNIGEHIVAIFAGQVDGIEPDEETKAKLIAQQAEEAKAAVEAKELKPEGNVVPFDPSAN